MVREDILVNVKMTAHGVQQTVNRVINAIQSIEQQSKRYRESFYYLGKVATKVFDTLTGRGRRHISYYSKLGSASRKLGIAFAKVAAVATVAAIAFEAVYNIFTGLVGFSFGLIKAFNRLGERILNLIHRTLRFRFELLSVMFFGMLLQRTFMGLLRPALELAGVFKLITTILKILFLPIALAILPIVLDIMKFIMSLPPEVKKAIGILVLLGAALGGLIFIFGSVALGVLGLITSFMNFATSLGSIIPIFGPFIGGLFGLIAALFGVSVAGNALGYLGSVLSEILGKFNLLDGARVILERLGVDIQGHKSIWEALKQTIINAVTSLLEKIGLSEDSIKKIVKTINGFIEIVEHLFNRAKKSAKLFLDILSERFSNAKGKATSFKDSIKSLINKVFDFIDSLIELTPQLLDLSDKLFETRENGKSLAEQIIDTAKKITERLVPSLLKLVDKITETDENGKSLIDRLLDLSVTISDTLIPSLLDLIEKLVTPPEGEGKSLAQIILEISSNLVEFTANIITLTDKLKPLWDWLGKLAERINGLLDLFKKGTSPELWEKMSPFLGPLWEIVSRAPPFNLYRYAVGAYQHGGLITRPTLAVLGEKGPELIIPAEKLRNAISGAAPAVSSPVANYYYKVEPTYNINVESISSDIDIRNLAHKLNEYLELDKAKSFRGY